MTVEPEIFNDETVNIADPEKTKWSFYIRFKVSEPLGIDQDSINFLEKFVIKSGSDLSLKETNILMLENTEPLIYREIIEVSTRVERALMLAFANLGIGTAYAENLASEKILEEIRNGMEKVRSGFGKLDRELRWT